MLILAFVWHSRCAIFAQAVHCFSPGRGSVFCTFLPTPENFSCFTIEQAGCIPVSFADGKLIPTSNLGR